MNVNQQKRKENELDDFDSFLSKVKEIGSIINDLSSKDTKISKKGMENADKYLNKGASTPDEDGIFTKHNKSSLNKKALETTYEAPDFSNMSAGEFMAAVEKDAEERYNRKQGK